LHPVQKYCGTLSPQEAIQILKHLKSIHNDDIKGIMGGEGGPKLASFAELIRELEAQQKRWRPLQLP
jgi:hypothetical protein